MERTDRARILRALHLLRVRRRRRTPMGERSNDRLPNLFRRSHRNARTGQFDRGKTGQHSAGIHRANWRRFGQTGMVLRLPRSRGHSLFATVPCPRGQGRRLSAKGALERDHRKLDLLAHLKRELPEQTRRSRVHHVVRVLGAGLGGVLWHASHRLHRAASDRQLHLRRERRRRRRTLPQHGRDQRQQITRRQCGLRNRISRLGHGFNVSHSRPRPALLCGTLAQREHRHRPLVRRLEKAGRFGLQCRSWLRTGPTGPRHGATNGDKSPQHDGTGSPSPLCNSGTLREAESRLSQSHSFASKDLGAKRHQLGQRPPHHPARGLCAGCAQRHFERLPQSGGPHV